MKFLLSLIICSQVHTTCMPAYQWPDEFNSSYDCMMFGYKEFEDSIKNGYYLNDGRGTWQGVICE